jgi:hypothetical protein
MEVPMVLRKLALLPLVAALAFVTPACGDGHDHSHDGHDHDHDHAPKTAAEPLPAGLQLAAAPAGAVDVKALKPAAKEGDEVVIRGRIGTLTPFVEGYAAMTIVDPSLVPCNEMEMEDGCKTPWDYCCTAPEEITASSATIQVVGADGRPLRSDLSAAGYKPLSWVVVKGKVGARPDPKVLVVNATGIFVERSVERSVEKK